MSNRTNEQRIAAAATIKKRREETEKVCVVLGKGWPAELTLTSSRVVRIERDCKLVEADRRNALSGCFARWSPIRTRRCG